jgi:hypothetical protein
MKNSIKEVNDFPPEWEIWILEDLLGGLLVPGGNGLVASSRKEGR